MLAATLPPASFPHWGDVPTWGLFAGAVVTAIFATLAFRMQSEQVRTLKDQLRDQHELTAKQTPVLELQAKELEVSLNQREEEAAERHRAHGRLISAILGPEEGPPEGAGEGRTAIDLINSSVEPVYTLVAGIVFIQGAGPATLERWLEARQQHPYEPVPITTASMLPAGIFRIWIQGVRWSGILSGRSAAEVAFTDRNGIHWIRRATGQLEELDEGPLGYFARLGFYGPHDLLTPERIA